MLFQQLNACTAAIVSLGEETSLKALHYLVFCRNRKTGFKCPRGCGKGSRFDQPCPGKVMTSSGMLSGLFVVLLLTF